MARLVFGMNVSLDGYVDHDAFAPDPGLFAHWIAQVGGLSASVYGRRIYELMRYWDDDHEDWSEAQRSFADVWRRMPKWVASRRLTSVGPNATLVAEDVGAVVRDLKTRLDGEIAVAGPTLAQAMTELGLVDEYRLYLHPAVVGRGTPFFAGPRPPLRLTGSVRMGDGVIVLSYVPAEG